MPVGASDVMLCGMACVPAAWLGVEMIVRHEVLAAMVRRLAVMVRHLAVKCKAFSSKV